MKGFFALLLIAMLLASITVTVVGVWGVIWCPDTLHYFKVMLTGAFALFFTYFWIVVFNKMNEDE